MRTTTSYGPVTYSDDSTPGRAASCLATTSARPTSVWISMKASTTRFSSVSLHRLLAAGTKRTAGPAGVQATKSGRRCMASDEPAESLAGLGEFAVIDRLVAGRDQPAAVVLGPGDDAAVVVGRRRQDRGVHRHAGGRAALPAGLVHAARRRPQGHRAERRRHRGDGCAGHRVRRRVRRARRTRRPRRRSSWPTACGRRPGCSGAGIVGGDLVSAPQWVISVTVLGDLGGRAAGAAAAARRPGDTVAVAGELGRSAAGYRVVAQRYSTASTRCAVGIWCRNRRTGRAASPPTPARRR